MFFYMVATTMSFYIYLTGTIFLWKVLGLVLEILIITFIYMLMDASINILLRFSKVRETTSYDNEMGDDFGKIGKMLLHTFVINNNLGILIIYLIIIGDFLFGSSLNELHHVGTLEELFGLHWWNGCVPILVLIIVLILAPLVSFKRINSSKFNFALPVSLIVVFFVITTSIAIVKLFSGTIQMPKLLPNIVDHTSFLNLFIVVPIIVITCLSLQCSFRI